MLGVGTLSILAVLPHAADPIAKIVVSLDGQCEVEVHDLADMANALLEIVERAELSRAHLANKQLEPQAAHDASAVKENEMMAKAVGTR